MWFLYVLPDYAKWHYKDSLKAFWGNVSNFLGFLVHFFSIALLFRTIFTPWRRMSESYTSGFDPGNFFSTLLVNGILRILGFIIRAFVLVVGLFLIVLFSVVSAFLFILWFAAPLVGVFLLSAGLLKLAGL
jgi:hypothetical protein